MAVDPNFASAFIDGERNLQWSGTKIFGVELRKFCLWHRLLLNTIESPFMNKGKVTLRDLRMAIGICRLEYGNSKIVMPKLGPFFMTLGLITRGLLSRPKKDAGPDAWNPLQNALARRVGVFLEYCGSYLQTPEYNIVQVGSRAAHPKTSRGSAPDELEHAAELITWSGWDEKTVWEMPLGKANWYRVMARKAAGFDVDVLTPEEKEFQRQIEAAMGRQDNGQ